MEWLLILLVLLGITINIQSFIALTRFKKQRQIMLEDSEAINSSMEEFVANLENENERLYNRFVELVSQKENRLEERLKQLEQKRKSEGLVSPAPDVSEMEKAEAIPSQQPVSMEIDPALPENVKIEQMHKQGFSPAQIAKVVAAERGEIELIINMFKKKQSYQK